jgi:hypothetical protein
MQLDTNRARRAIPVRSLIAALAASLMLALPAVASADATFCVHDEACSGTDYATPQEALDAAKANPGDDVVQIGASPVPLEGSLVYDDASPDNNVTIRGAGVERTGLLASAGTTVELASGSSIEDLIIGTPDVGSGGTGLVLHGGAARRVVIAYTGTYLDTKGLVMNGGGELSDVAVHMDTGTAITVKGGAGMVVNGSDVFARGRYGIKVEEGAKLLLLRARIWARTVGALVMGPPSGVATSALTIRNAELLVNGPGGDGIVGLSGSSVYANHVTALHLGGGGGTGLRTSAVGGTAVASLWNTVLDGFEEHSLERYGVAPYSAVQHLVNSSFDPATAAIGPAQGPGEATQQGNIFASDPMFLDRPVLEPTEEHDLRLRTESPLVDSGILTSGNLPVDFGKLDRVTDGNGDGVEVPDIGAHELQPQPQPQPAGGGATDDGTGGTGATGAGGQGGGDAPMADILAPGLSGLRASARRARFRLSEQARVTLRLKRRGTRRVRVLRVSGAAGGNRMAFRSRARRLRAGRYRLAVRAVDAAGNQSTTLVLRFRVTR